MKCLLLVILANFIFKVVDGAVNERSEFFPNAMALIQEIQNFYNTPGVFLVYDAIDDVIDKQLTVRLFSRSFIMSQVISYDDLEKVNKIGSRDHKSSALFVVILNDSRHVTRFRFSTRNFDISDNLWFVLIATETGIDCERPAGNPFNVKMNTRMLAYCWASPASSSIKKFYSAYKNTTEVVEIGNWTSGSKLIMADESDGQVMRNRMHGRIITASALSNVFNPNWKNYMDNFVGEIATLLNLTIQVEMEGNAFGYQDEITKEWFGLMETIAEEKVEMVLELLSMTVSRMQVVDFTYTLILSPIHLYAKIPDSSYIDWSAYFLVFDKSCWIMLAFTILILTLVIGSIENYLEGRWNWNASMFFENLLNVWGIYTQQGSSETPKHTALRILYFWMFISSMILNYLYSASITSYITVLTKSLPFTSVDEFLRSSYKLVVLSGSRNEELITKNDHFMGGLKKSLKKSGHMPSTTYDGFLEACNENIAFYSDDIAYSGRGRSLPCVLGSLRLNQVECLALALAKRSPYTETINYCILRLMGNGIAQRLKSMYLARWDIGLSNPKTSRVSLWETVPILSIWFIGAIVSFTVLCFEIIAYYLCKIQRARLMRLPIRNYIKRRVFFN